MFILIVKIRDLYYNSSSNEQHIDDKSLDVDNSINDLSKETPYENSVPTRKFLDVNPFEMEFLQNNLSELKYSKNDLSYIQYPKVYMVNGHCIMPNVITRQMEEDPDRITLILHMSFNRLDESVKIQTANWEGPISLAVVFPPEYTPHSYETYCSIKFVISCFLTLIITSVSVERFTEERHAFTSKIKRALLFSKSSMSRIDFYR